MKTRETALRRRWIALVVLSAGGLWGTANAQTAAAPAEPDPLPSWNEGATKKAIVEFVHDVTATGSAGFVPVAERIATFDNDGTLWVEQPMYVQFLFALERVKLLAPKHPEWKKSPALKAAIAGDVKALMATGERGIVEVVMATHAGMSTAEFEQLVQDWLATAKDARFHQLHTDCVYLPMLELMAYLRANGFKTYIVSGGGVEFMRPWTERVYGVPPEQVIGSSIKTKYDWNGGAPALMRLPQIDFIDNNGGKPEGINQFIGRRPIAAFGNSDGDQQMLEWAAARKGRSLAVIVHHTDAVREYAYDRKSEVGHLDKALDEGMKSGWVIVDMKSDWKRIFKWE